MTNWVAAPTVEMVLAKAKLPFELEPGQRSYMAKVCADKRVKDVWVARYSLGGSILLRWDMRFGSNRALQYYSPHKRKKLLRHTRLMCEECNGVGTVLAYDGPHASTDEYHSEPCPVCTKWHKANGAA